MSNADRTKLPSSRIGPRHRFRLNGRFRVRPAATGTAGNRGFFYHYLDMDTGVRAGQSELSTVDTALLLGGVLFCRSYFAGADADETEIRALAEAIYARVDWRWAQVRPPSICHGWSPEGGFLEFDWRGYNEAMIVYLLALGSPSYPVAPEAWGTWTSTYDQCWSAEFGQPHLAFAPLFGHQYSQTWIDFRGLQDAYMRARGFDYFENNRRAVYAQRAKAEKSVMARGVFNAVADASSD